MAKKKTSKRLAKIAGKFLNMDAVEFIEHFLNFDAFHNEVLALSASVLSQYESEKKKK